MHAQHTHTQHAGQVPPACCSSVSSCCSNAAGQQDTYTDSYTTQQACLTAASAVQHTSVQQTALRPSCSLQPAGMPCAAASADQQHSASCNRPHSCQQTQPHHTHHRVARCAARSARFVAGWLRTADSRAQHATLCSNRTRLSRTARHTLHPSNQCLLGLYVSTKRGQSAASKPHTLHEHIHEEGLRAAIKCAINRQQSMRRGRVVSTPS